MITSVRNPKVAGAAKLKKRAFRERERRFLVEGAQALGEALGRPGGLEILFHTDPSHPLLERARAARAATIHVGDEVAAALTSTVTPQGVVGVAPFLDVSLDDVEAGAGCAVVLHAVRDPGNAGTVLRSADAAGADAVIFSGGSVDPYNPKTVRSSAGSLFHLPIVRADETSEAIRRLRGAGRIILAMDAEGREDVFRLDLSEPVALVFGNEAWGLPEEIARLADRTVRIPIAHRAESLNLAAAATVCLFEWTRQRRGGRDMALDTLIASAAHDIRSPLTAMKGFGYALSTRWQQMSDEQRAMMLEGIVYDTERLDTTLRLLVDAARIASGSLDLFPERIELGGIVAKLASSLARDPEHPGIAWESGEIRAFVDPDRVRCVLESFVEALVWWAADGPVRIHGAVDGGRLVLEAFRAGTELDAEEAEALFRPRRPGEGGGSKIGLFVSEGIARVMGGTASVEVDGGLRFRLDVPLPADDDMPAEELGDP